MQDTIEVGVAKLNNDGQEGLFLASISVLR